MASPLSSNDSIYFTNFETGNDFTPSTYFQYAADLDSNFSQIRTTVNQLVLEVQAVQGSAAAVALDMALPNDPASSPQQNGVIGQHSYRVTINGTPSLLDVAPGQAILSGISRVTLSPGVQLNGTALGVGAVTAFVSIDANGLVYLSSGAGSHVLDIASVAWNGTQFTGAVTQLAEILFDGDDYRTMRVRATTGNWASKSFRRVGDRLGAIERALTGISTDVDGSAVSVIGCRGSAALPGIVVSDGTTPDTDSGLFRQAADVLGFSATGTERWRTGTFGIQAAQDGSAGAPFFSRTTATNRGFYFTTNGVAVSVAGAQQVEFLANQMLNAVGSAANPSYAFIGDAVTGIFREAANTLGFGTNGVQRARFDSTGNLDLITQTRGIASRVAVLSLATTATLSTIAFDTETEDVGASFAPTSADITVPTGADGRWRITLNVVFVESTSSSPNVGDRRVAIQVAGNTFNIQSSRATVAGNTTLTTSYETNVTAGQVIRGLQSQDSGGAMDTTSNITWMKVA